MSTISQLKARARKTLGNGIFTNEWMFALLVVVIIDAITTLTSSFVIGIIITGLISFGINKYFLYRSRNLIKHDSLEVLFDGVKGDVAGNLVLGLLTTLYIFLWALLFLIPGIVKSYSYSMVYFIKIDHPEYTAKQAMSESERLMKGNKTRLFLLDLSFIGWMFVGALCFGVGSFWVSAYMQATYAEFYRDLIGETETFYEA